MIGHLDTISRDPLPINRFSVLLLLGNNVAPRVNCSGNDTDMLSPWKQLNTATR